jgi:riboflavin kinase/FMN adenylyltransferase
MRIVTDRDAAGERSPEGLFVTVGNFDGFHRGHQSVLSELLSASVAAGGSAVAVTFEPHPAEVLFGSSAPALLTPGAERYALLATTGLEELRVVSFTSDTAGMDAAAFLLFIGVGRGSHLVLGYDFHMGRGRAADLERLSALGEEWGFGLDVVPPVLCDGRPISSTRIRDAVEAGEVDSARDMLGRPYVVAGRVVSGRGIGRGLGYATANLELPERKLLPADGVYLATAAARGGDRRPALVYVGRRPSVGVHVLDVETDLYGEVVEAELAAFLRRDKQFGTTEELRAQIELDVAEARRRLGPG